MTNDQAASRGYEDAKYDGLTARTIINVLGRGIRVSKEDAFTAKLIDCHTRRKAAIMRVATATREV